MKALRNGGDNIIVYEYPNDSIQPIRQVLQSGQYINVYGAFDIETTVINWHGDYHGIMYVWQFAIGKSGGDLTVYIGRTWRDYQKFLSELRALLRLNSKKRLVIWVHNLSYEFQWLRSIGDVTRMFAVKKRVPIVAEFNDVFEYRCSYKLSNMSLDKFAKEERVEHRKQSNYDYNKKRYPDTKLSDDELLYTVCDVLALHESVSSIMRTYKDDLSTVPYTSTGYVRREARERVHENKQNRYDFKDTRLSAHQYKLCKSAARGGNTHANVLYTNQIIENVHSMDKSSSYPFQMVAAKFPRGRLVEDGCKKVVRDAANIMLVELVGVSLKDGVYFPYISYAKCERVAGVDYRGCRFDNGRVLCAPILYMTITDIDYDIIIQQYHIEHITILEQYVSEYGYLNEEYRGYVLELYKAKCELKKADPYFYGKFKNKINALFGMMLTDITRENITYIKGEWGSELPPVIDALNDYYKNYRSFLSYQDGIFVTANARRDLQFGLDAVGIDGVYCDTDSVKYVGDHKHEFDQINAKIRQQLSDAGVKPVVVDDTTYELGVWEDDADYAEFITQGAKKYAYRYSDDKLNGDHAGTIGITVAGLNKRKGAEYLRTHGGLNAFCIPEGETEGAVFSELDSGRMVAKYHDDIGISDIVVDGHKCELTSNIALVPTTYTLSYSKDYAELIKLKNLVN